MLGCLFGHFWVTVQQFDGGAMCGKCFRLNLKCVHNFKVCMRCGKAEGHGSHGKLTVIPDSCKAEIAYMRLGTNYKGNPGEV